MNDFAILALALGVAAVCLVAFGAYVCFGGRLVNPLHLRKCQNIFGIEFAGENNAATSPKTRCDTLSHHFFSALPA
jgi:hypothetical protein